MRKLDPLRPFCILLCIAFAHAEYEKKGIKWGELMADKKKQAEVNRLYTENYMRATNWLLAAVTNELYNEASPAIRRELKRCIASIAKDDKNPQKSEAKCVMNAFNMLDKEKTGIQWVGALGVRRMKHRAVRATRFSQYGSNFNGPVKFIDFLKQPYMRFRSRISQQGIYNPKRNRTLHSNRRSKTFVRQRQLVTNSSFVLITKESDESVFLLRAQRANNLSHEALITAANGAVTRATSRDANGETKRLRPNYFVSGERPSHNIARIVGNAEQESEEVVVRRMQSMPNLMEEVATRSPVAALANLASQILRGDSGNKTWKQTYEKVKELNEEMKMMKKIEASNRAYSNVLRESSSFALAKTDEEALGPDEDKNPLKEVQNMNAIIDGLGDTKNENFEFLSPKIIPLMPPDGVKKKRILSPTLFSFYKDEEDPMNIASMPDMMNGTAFKADDRDAVLDLIMEASGARAQVEKTLEGLSGLADWQDIAKAMIEANQKMNATWMKLLQSMTKKQLFELDSKGFAFAEPKQLEEMYFRDDAFYQHVPQCDVPFDEYKQYNDGDRKHLLRRMIGQIARDIHPEMSAAMRSWPKRMKQRFLAPLIFDGQIGTPSLLGFVILSPMMFVASVFSPLVMNFELLSPRVFFPVILGPFFISPRILSPRALGVLVLSPVVLTPAIIRPLVLHPFILSPFMLSPAILSSSALGGRILSPALLNPAVLSPGAVNADVLSPTLLSRRRRKRYTRLHRRHR